MPKTRFSALLSLLLVFFSGAVLGAFAYRLYSVRTVQTTGIGGPPPGRRLTPEEFRRHYVASLTKAAKLDDRQVAALNGILDQTRDEAEKLNEKIKPERDALNEKWRPERESIQSRQVERITALLRPDQLPLYEAWRAERDREHKLHEQQRDQFKK
ncbi:MAG TPA: hypothetical protein VMH28_01170 [Candidatus Acidoferrales bacterium]|nr:hypothetical protein [Candidatus Acidoferrales bacterium]